MTSNCVPQASVLGPTFDTDDDWISLYLTHSGKQFEAIYKRVLDTGGMLIKFYMTGYLGREKMALGSKQPTEMSRI
jgi:hypothetical protein